MITVNYQLLSTRGFSLRLRLYSNVTKEVRYIRVNKLLSGNIQKKHWNVKKQIFYPGAPHSEENNDILAKFKAKYADKAMNWKGSVESLLLEMNNGVTRPDTHKFKDVIAYIVTELKKDIREDGTIKGTYETYEKVGRRMKLFCDFSGLNYDELAIEDFTPELINRMFDWIQFKNNNKGMLYMSQTIHAILVRCEKMGFFQMKPVEYCRWAKKKKASAYKYDTLTKEQCKKFIEMDIRMMNLISRNTRNELYHDFCVFILYTCQSACDAISLKYSDIQHINGVDHFVFKRRKIAEKQSVACTVPINHVMKAIMDKWKPMSKDGYIFPIRNKKKIADSETNNGDIKHFISRINMWLKKIAIYLGVDFSLRTYTFRHTGITHYISSGVTPIYVANLAGTSVDNCEKIYYNNQGDETSRNQVLNALI